MNILDWNSHFILNIFGMCESGKSHLLKYIIYKASLNKNINHVILFTNTSFNNQYNYIPDKYIHTSFNPEIINNYMELQREVLGNGEKSRGLIVFDDILGEAQFNCKEFLKLITQFRQFNLSVIICSQTVTDIPHKIRCLAQYCCSFEYQTKRSVEALFESYGLLFDTWKEYKEFMNKSTGNYKFLFFDRKMAIKGREHAYKSIRAPAKIPQFQLNY